MKLLRIKLPDSLHARLKVQAATDGSMQVLAVVAIRQLLDACDVQRQAQLNPALASANPQKRGL